MLSALAMNIMSNSKELLVTKKPERENPFFVIPVYNRTDVAHHRALMRANKLAKERQVFIRDLKGIVNNLFFIIPFILTFTLAFVMIAFIFSNVFFENNSGTIIDSLKIQGPIIFSVLSVVYFVLLINITPYLRALSANSISKREAEINLRECFMAHELEKASDKKTRAIIDYCNNP